MKLKLFHYLMGVILALLWLPLTTYGQDDLTFEIHHATSFSSSDGYIEVTIAGGQVGNEIASFDFELTSDNPAIEPHEFEDVTFPANSERKIMFSGLSDGTYCVSATKYSNTCTETAGQCNLKVEACINPSDCIMPDFYSEYDGCGVQFHDTSVGDIANWHWDFGDGNIESGAYLSDPYHEYYSPGTYTVTMIITDENGTQNSTTQSLSVSCGDGDSYPDCSINAPSFVSLGQTFVLSGEAFDGIGPYTYEWELPFELNQLDLFGPGPHNITFSESSFLHNGDVITIYLSIYDAFGNYTSCSREITISGEIPDVDLLVFPNLGGDPFPPNSYMSFVVFADTWNLSFDACYKFNVVKKLNSAGDTEPVPGFPTNCQYAYDLNGVSFETGHYKVCVDVIDGGNIYQDCETFVVGEPGDLPPPAPAIVIEYLSTEGWKSEVFGLESCGSQELRVESAENQNNLAPYVNDYQVLFFFIESGSLSEGQSYAAIANDEINPNGFSNGTGIIDVVMGVPSHDGWFIDGSGLEVGKVYDVIVRVCSTDPNDPTCQFIARHPAMITVIGSEIELEAMELDLENCNPMLCIEADCGKTFGDGNYRYEWNLYHYNDPDVVISNSTHNLMDIPVDADFPWDGPNSTNFPCISIDMSHPYFQQFQGEEAHFYAEVIVEDADGHRVQKKEYISIPLPLKIVLEDELFRCPSDNVNLVSGEVAIGGTGNYNYTWSLDGAVISTSPNPIVSYNGNETEVYTFTVSDGSCSISKDIIVKWSDLVLDIFSANYHCNTDYELILGPYHDDLGGSGQYEFQWGAFLDTSPPTSLTVSEYLDNPYSLNPKVIQYSNHPTFRTIKFYLTVTDILSDCQVTRFMHVSDNSLISKPIAIAHEDDYLEICHGAGISLGSSQNGIDGATTPTGDPTVPSITWSSNHPLFVESNDAVLTLPESFGQLPGDYFFKVRVEDANDRCAATDEVNVVIRKPWIYEGFQSNIISSNPPVELEFAWNENSSNKIYTESENQASGAVGDFSYEWLPDNPDDNNDQQSSNGYLRQSKFNPLLQNHHTIKVTDNGTGCSQEFKTNRHLVFEDTDPTGEISSTAPNEGECDIVSACFDVSVNLPYLGNGVLPNTLTVGIKIIATNFNGGTINNIHNYTRLLNLDLKNQGQSTYEGRFCYTPEDLSEYGIYHCRLIFSNNSINNTSVNPWYPGFFGTSIQLDEAILIHNSDRLVPYYICAPDEINQTKTLKAIRVVAGIQPGPVLCFDENTITNGSHQVDFIGGLNPNGGVHLYRGFHAERGSNFHAYIDPCLELEDNLEENNPQERSSTTESLLETPEQQPDKPLTTQHQLTLFPNPFNSYLTIDYQIETTTTATVTLNLLDISGKKIHTLIDNEERDNGQYQIEYNTADLSAGVYFYELLVNNRKITKKAVKVDF